MNEKRSVKTAVISFFLFSLLFLLHYSDVISISIKTATPIILLPLLCAFSMFSTPRYLPQRDLFWASAWIPPQAARFALTQCF